MAMVVVAAAGTGGTGETGAGRPNILLIVADDHGTDAVGCYGNRVIKTPHLDGLARAGIRFTHAFCTTASCSPSRSVILTGWHGHHNGMYGLQHQEHHFQSFDGVKSLPAMLAAAGYRTGRIGKLHVAPAAVYQFQAELGGGMANDPASIGRSPVAMADGCKGFIGAADPRPFFLYFATDDPHRSNSIGAGGKPAFDTYPKPNPFGNRPEGYPGITPVAYSPAEVLVPPFLPDTREARAELAEYYQAVSRLDQGIGRLLDHVRSAGRWEDTLIVYISDNGAAFPMAKTTLYEPGIRLPCLIRLPGGRAGEVEDAMITWADLTPTLLDLAGAMPAGAAFDGRSFRRVIEGKGSDGWDEVYASHTMHEVTMYYPMRMIRTRTHKLICNFANGLPYPMALDLVCSPTWIGVERAGGKSFGPRRIEDFLHRPRFELYDLEADPGELVNLAYKPGHQRVLEGLLTRLKEFQQRTSDPWFHKWSYE
jgi:N-sulfoglucosamine sulfohydrolase